MRLIAALNRERARRQPLPEPLPNEPPVPFEYLIRLYTTISNPDYLTPLDQAALVGQLQVGLGQDGQHDAARNDIVMLLTKQRCVEPQRGLRPHTARNSDRCNRKVGCPA
jgi:serine/threonine kinase PknH